VQRPEQHITDSEADLIFRSAFTDWSVAINHPDYGRDYVVEVFRNKQSTGLLFNCQLKGSRSTEYSSDRSFISQSLKIRSAEYLAKQLRQPSFLFHADVEAKKLFWSAIQLDEEVLEKLGKGEIDSVTVRLPTTNVLPDCRDRFLQDLDRAEMAVARRILRTKGSLDYAAAMASQRPERAAENAKDLHEKAFHLEFDLADRQRQDGDIAGAIAILSKIVSKSSDSDYLEIHFNGVIRLGELEVLQLMKSEVPQALVADKKLAIAHELCRIAKRVPKPLHLYAQVSKRAAELGVEVHKTFGLLMSLRAHRQRGEDLLWIAVLSFQVQQALLVTHRKYKQAIRLAQATAGSRYRKMTPLLFAEIALTVGTFGRVLETCDFAEAGLQYQKTAFDLFKFAAAVATENRSMPELFQAVMQARVLEREKDGPIISWVRSVVDGWKGDSDYRRNAELLLTRMVDRLDGIEFEEDIKASPRQIHYNILTSAGFDPMTEPWAGIVDLAIKDGDPTRVLVECEHKFVAKYPGGDLMLERLALESANPKIIACDIHGHSLGGRTLDGIDKEFRRKYCDSCRDKTPHPAGWTFYKDPFWK